MFFSYKQPFTCLFFTLVKEDQSIRVWVPICHTYEYVTNVLHMRTVVRMRNNGNVNVLRLRTILRTCNMLTS